MRPISHTTDHVFPLAEDELMTFEALAGLAVEAAPTESLGFDWKHPVLVHHIHVWALVRFVFSEAKMHVTLAS